MAKLASLFHISVWLLAGQVSCGSITAWWTSRGPSFIMQDDDTGGIRYSLCNGNSTPIFPDDKTLTVPFTNTPKNKTSLTGAGWTDSETAWASIFYLDNNDEIVNALLKCDWNTGHWQSSGEYITSEGSPKVSPTSALSVVLLGSTDGYRVFYNDLEGTLHQVGYTTSTAWAYYGVVSQDQTSAQAIGSTFTDKNNISVVRPRDDKNIGVSRWYSDNLWHISTLPEPLTLTGNQSTNATQASDLTLSSSATNFSLPAWNGNASAIAMGVDSSYTRSVFYVGSDRKVYQIGNKNYTWSVSDTDNGAWPLADTAGGALGIANDVRSDSMRLYWTSGGKVVEANGDGGTWQTPTTVASFNASEPTASATPSASGTSSDGGLSGGAKAGVGVGVSLGVLAVAGIFFALWFLRKRQRKLEEKAAAAGGSEQYTPSSGFAAPTTADGSQVGPKILGSHDGYAAPQQGYPPVQNAYGQQQGMYPQQPAGYAVGADGYAHGAAPGTYPQQAGFVQDGGWAYTTPTADNGAVQQQYYYQQQPPQELPDQQRAVEMMGEGHYKEVP
ncbi:hypothetical protein F4804DRAFT_80498 [Jackrogersella minutella]|nr:hypothetical protein F4804DRAFT_80498 [Jackrogersella minutella]